MFHKLQNEEEKFRKNQKAFSKKNCYSHYHEFKNNNIECIIATEKK